MDPHEFFEYLARRQAISATLKQSILPVLKMQDIKKKGNLLKAGQFCERIWFLRTGIVRWHRYIHDKDVTTWIQPAKGFVIDSASLYERIPATENIEALDNSSTYYISYHDLISLYRDYPAFQDTIRQIINEQQHARDQHTIALRMSATKKYEYFLKTFANQIGSVPAGYIASFLDMVSGTFYKLRKQNYRKL